MDIDRDQLFVVMSQFNPWWRGEEFFDIPRWRRAAWGELAAWLAAPPARRAVLISGARQIGKTTLLLQAVKFLLDRKVPPANILYATFDHPVLKLAGIDAVLEAWRQREPRAEGPEYILLDEAQFIRGWGTWIKHQVDFFRDRRIIFTGSAVPLLESDPESGVGRWHTIRLTTLSFYEYLKITKAAVPELPTVRGAHEIAEKPQHELLRITEIARPYVGHFHEYLVRGGFPQTALVENVAQAQRLLREDIVDKVLKRDMTALFGVRRILELEHTFLYLCMHGGGLLDMPALCSNLEVKRPTAQSFIDLLGATHLIYRLQPYGYGKEVLRGRYKVYLADPGIAPAVMLRGKEIVDNAAELGLAVETAVFKHLVTRFYARQVRFSYWRGKQSHEVDIVADLGTELVPFEVKYRSEPTRPKELKGLLEFCEQKQAQRAYIVTRNLTDFGPVVAKHAATQITCIPAPLLCYWTGEAETRIGLPEVAA